MIHSLSLLKFCLPEKFWDTSMISAITPFLPDCSCLPEIWGITSFAAADCL